MKLGYACINMDLSYPTREQKKKGMVPITTNRTMIKRTFLEKGNDYASELALANVKDLKAIIEWNIKHGIKFFRMASDMFPWSSEFEIESMKHYDEIKYNLGQAGDLATRNDVRLSFHPGPFNVLASPSEKVVQRCITDLTIHGKIMDMLNQSRTPYNKINIHVGGAYGDKKSALERFCKNFHRLPDSVKTRLTVENDDKASMYSTKDLYEGVYKNINIPIVFDYHHHKFCDGGQTEKEALTLAASTWNGIVPACHYSESRALEQNDPSIRGQAHSDFVYEAVDTHGIEFDLMFEAKMKNQAVLKYRELHG